MRWNLEMESLALNVLRFAYFKEGRKQCFSLEVSGVNMKKCIFLHAYTYDTYGVGGASKYIHYRHYINTIYIYIFSCTYIDRTYINSSSSSWKKKQVHRKKFYEDVFRGWTWKWLRKTDDGFAPLSPWKNPGCLDDCLRVGVFSFRYFALDKIPWNSCWVRISKKNRPFQCPKKEAGDRRFRIPTHGPPQPGHGNPHTARDHFGERSRSRCFLAWELKTRQKNGGTTDYVHTPENWLAGKSSMNEVCMSCWRWGIF